jgi:hypothetical protein
MYQIYGNEGDVADTGYGGGSGSFRNGLGYGLMPQMDIGQDIAIPSEEYMEEIGPAFNPYTPLGPELIPDWMALGFDSLEDYLASLEPPVEEELPMEGGWGGGGWGGGGWGGGWGGGGGGYGGYTQTPYVDPWYYGGPGRGI